MGKSAIEWLASSDGTQGATWPLQYGCSAVSVGCTNCYATRTVMRFQDKHGGDLVRMSGGKPVWTGKIAFNEKNLDWPLRLRKPTKIFVTSQSDLFHESVPDEWIDKVFAVMALCPRHTFIVLTKRPERMKAYMTEDGIGRVGYVEGRAKRMLREIHGTDNPMLVGKTLRWPLPHAWLGVSCEDQATADERIPLLLQTPAAVRVVSAEPLLGPIDLMRIAPTYDADGEVTSYTRALPDPADPAPKNYLSWVIAGGESGPKARPMHPDWARSLRDQCVTAGVAFFFKQVGEWGWGSFLQSGPNAERRILFNDGMSISDTYEARQIENVARGWAGRDAAAITKTGKKAAGRELDRRTWDEVPNAR